MMSEERQRPLFEAMGRAAMWPFKPEDKMSGTQQALVATVPGSLGIIFGGVAALTTADPLITLGAAVAGFKGAQYACYKLTKPAAEEVLKPDNNTPSGMD